MADVAATIEEQAPAALAPGEETWRFRSKSGAADIALAVVELRDGWRATWEATLPDAGLAAGSDESSQSVAFTVARETVIRWLAEQKQQGGKRHRTAAEEAQDWLLALAPEFPAAAPAPAPPALESAAPEWFPLEKLRESPLNPRQFIPEAGIIELAESMRANGFRTWLPLVARPCGDGFAELAAGHRRRLGALRAGLTHVPVVLRAMSDDEFLDVLNFDNSGREDVHPLHEAAGWHDWLKRPGHTVLGIVARIGKSKEYVYQRLKYAELIPEAREAFLEKKFSADHAVRIARQTPEVQAKALVFMQPRWNGQIPTTRELDDWLHYSTTDLANAPFDREDAELLPAVGTCVACPKMSANDPGAAAEFAGRELCQDPLCYGKKVAAHLVRIEERLKAAGTPMVRVSNQYSTQKKGVLNRGAFEPLPSGRKDAKAVTAVVVEGPGIGTEIQVRVSTPAAGSGKAAGSPAKVKALQEAAAAKLKEKREAELAVRTRILDAVLVKAGGAVSVEDLRVLVTVIVLGHVGADDLWLCRRRGVTGHNDNRWKAGECLKKALPHMAPRAIADLAIELSVADEFEDYKLDKPSVQLLALAKRHKVDASKVRATVEGERKKAAAAAAKAPTKAAVPAKSSAAKKKGKKK